MRQGRLWACLVIALAFVMAIPAAASAVVLPTQGHYWGHTHEKHSRHIGFSYHKPTVKHFHIAHHVILDQGHVHQNATVNTSQDGVHVQMHWTSHHEVSGTISQGGHSIRFQAALLAP